MSQHKSPCADCAFRRDSKPGNLGGSDPGVYVGQTSGPFWIPCHCSKDYRGKESVYGEEKECAGVAIYRANLGLDERMPDALLKLPADHDAVFSSHAEFVAHHTGMTIAEATRLLELLPPEGWLAAEFAKAGRRNIIPNPNATNEGKSESV